MRLACPSPSLATRERATASHASDSGVRRFVTHGVFPVVAQIWCRIARAPCSTRSARRDRALTRTTPVGSSHRSHRQDHHPRGGVLRHHRQRQGQDSGQRRCVSCHSRANHDVVFLRAIRDARERAARVRFPGGPRRQRIGVTFPSRTPTRARFARFAPVLREGARGPPSRRHPEPLAEGGCHVSLATFFAFGHSR